MSSVLVTVLGRTDWLDPLRWGMIARVATEPGVRVAVLTGGSLVPERALQGMVDAGWALYRDDTPERPLAGPNVYLTPVGEEAVRSGREWIRSVGRTKGIPGTADHRLRPELMRKRTMTRGNRAGGPTYHLIGSATSLDGLVDLIKKKWYWETVVLEPTSDRTWSVASGKGISPTLRVVQKGRRFRLERTEAAPDQNRAAWHGLSAGRSPSSFDQRQLRIGAREEMKEHGLSRDVARRIAMDHLVEDPHYYTPGATHARSKDRAVPLASVLAGTGVAQRQRRRFAPSAYFTAVAVDTGGTARRAYQGPSLTAARERAAAAASQWRMPVTVVDERWNEIKTYRPDEGVPDTTRDRAVSHVLFRLEMYRPAVDRWEQTGLYDDQREAEEAAEYARRTIGGEWRVKMGDASLGARTIRNRARPVSEKKRREVEALKLVEAGADLLEGAPVRFEWEKRKEDMWVSFTTYSGHEKTELVKWDERGPYLYHAGSKWRWTEGGTRGAKGMLVPERRGENWAS